MRKYSYSSLQILWKLLGLTPFSFGEKGKIKFSYPIFIISLSIISWAVPQTIYSVYLDVKSDCRHSIRSTNLTSTVAACCDIGTLMLAACICVIFASIYSHKLAKVYVSLTKINTKLASLKFPPKTDYFESVILVMFCILLIADIITGWDYFFYYVPTYVFHLIILGLELQISAIVLKIKLLFHKLNDNFYQSMNQNIKQTSNEYNLLPSVNLLRGSKNRISQILSTSEFSQLHWKLCVVIDDVNLVFGVQLAAIFLSIFIHIITTSYFMFISINNLKGKEAKAYFHPILDILWVLAYVAQLCLLVWPCAVAKKEGARMASVICRFINKDIPNEIRKQCETFLLQLLHHNIRFTALGLFTLDFPVVTSIAGAVSTYLVILIQFQETSNKCD